MTREDIQQLKDKAWATKTQEQWDAVMIEIKNAVSEDAQAANILRAYCKSILPKKKDYFEKYGNKKQFPPKSSYILREDEGKAFTNLCNALAEYLKTKTITSST